MHPEERAGAKGSFLSKIILVPIISGFSVAGLNMLCMEKTGTLTLNKMTAQVSQIFPLRSVISFG